MGAADAPAVGVDDPDTLHTAGVPRRFGKRLQGHEQPRAPGPGPAAARVVGMGPDRPVPLPHRERRPSCEPDRRHQVTRAPSERAAGDEAKPAVAVRAGDGPVPDLALDALEVRTGDEVDHAGDGIRAVGCGGPFAQHLDTLERGLRQQVHVHDELRLIRNRSRREGKALPVQEHERAARTEPAQIDGCPVRPGPGPVLVRLAVGALAEGQVAQDVDEPRGTLLAQLVARDPRDRERRVLRCTGDPGPGHDNDFEGSRSVLHRGSVGLCRARQRAKRKCGEENRRAVPDHVPDCLSRNPPHATSAVPVTPPAAGTRSARCTPAPGWSRGHSPVRPCPAPGRRRAYGAGWGSG